MHAMRAERFGGYQDLKLVEIPKPGVLAAAAATGWFREYLLNPGVNHS